MQKLDLIKLSLFIAISLVSSCTNVNSISTDFKEIFNGQNLNGWHKGPRIPINRYTGKDLFKPTSANFKQANSHTGKWEVVNGVLEGGQEPIGSRLGACLISDKKYGDFEIKFDAKPDWPIDTGIMFRTPRFRANVGYQVLIDHRPGGGIGGFYGNGIAGFHQLPFRVEIIKDINGTSVGLKAVKEKDSSKTSALTYSCSPEDFMDAWKFGNWNSFRIKCVGRVPIITVWINNVKISEIDTSKIIQEGYDPYEIANRLGSRGHISFEVHNNDREGWDRWGKGAVARWKNIFIKEL